MPDRSPGAGIGAPSRAVFVLVAAAGILGAAGVGLAAIAAHKVESPALVAAANMLMIHAAAAVGLSALAAILDWQGLLWPTALMLLAASLFSGTIAVNTVTSLHAPVMLAPIGGSLLIVSWLLVAALAALRSMRDSRVR